MNEKKFTLSPTMMFILLTGITIVISGVLSFFNLQTEYNTINTVTGKFDNETVEVISLFSLSGLKYIVTTAVSGFANFAPLSMLIIVLIGIGILEKSGFTKTFFTLVTRSAKKNTLTFLLIFVSMAFSIVGDLGYVVMLPIGALLFKYGKRNPMGGIIASFAAMSFGYGVNIFLSVTDSSLLQITLDGANMLDAKYTISQFFSIGIMTVAMIAMSIAMTFITERTIMPKLPKYESEDLEDVQITNRDLRGLIVGIGAGLIYALIVAYMIIPGLPFSGALLDDNGKYYIDKLFGENSLFNQGFIFIITLFFFLVGFFYGIMAKTIKTNKDVAEALGHSLDGIGNILVLIFFASLFIGVFKKTEIGAVITAMLSQLIVNLNISGVALVILLFLCAMISNIFYPSPTIKWAMLGVSVPVFMNASLSPEYAQIIYSAGASVTNGLTPLLAYFVIFIAYMEKFGKQENVTLFGSIKLLIPYSFAVLVIWFILIIGWYVTGIPIGVGALPGVNYVS